MSESDARFAAAKFLDKRFFEYPHLSGDTDGQGDYLMTCTKCGMSETYHFAGKNEVDAQTFALSFTGRHIHD